MCAGMLVQISRHLSKTSNNNNNKRCKLCIPCMLCRVRFHRVLHQISDLWPLLYYNCLYPALPLMLYSTSLLLLSYYTWVFSAWYHLLYINFILHTLLTIQFSMHIYDLDLLIHVYLSMHATWHSHHHSLGSSDSPGSSCPDFRVWSLQILPIADQRCVAEAWIIGRPSRALSFQAPYSTLEFSCCNSWAPFVLFILIYLFVFS